MYRVQAPITENVEVCQDTWLLGLDAPEIATSARPGQFVHLNCGEGYEHLLRRPFSLHRTYPDRGVATLLYRPVGDGTEWLVRQSAGTLLDALGPLGQAFDIASGVRNLLLVAGGYGVAPLVPLSEQAAAQGMNVTLIEGARTAAQIYPATLVAPEVEYRVATDDGTLGYHGRVTEVAEELVPWADQILSCGSMPMMQALTVVVRRKRLRLEAGFLMGALEQRMGCAMGVCLACVVPTRHGLKRVCTEGPVFDLKDVF